MSYDSYFCFLVYILTKFVSVLELISGVTITSVDTMTCSKNFYPRYLFFNVGAMKILLLF